MARFQVKIEDDNRVLRPFTLALDDRDLPIYSSHLLEPVHISVYSQSEEARYANLLPGVGSVYAQDDLSGGLGKKVEVHREEPQFDRYYYGEWFDGSVRGHAQKGAAVTTLSAPSNSGTLTGYFQLSGVPYLVLSRRIASWASDSLTARHDYTAGIGGGEAATFVTLGSEASVESNTTTDTVGTLTSADTRLAQSFRYTGTSVVYLSKVVLKMLKTSTPTGDVKLEIQPDLNGAPSGQAITSARFLADTLSGSAGTQTFRFDDDFSMVLAFNVPYWLVLSGATMTSTNNASWSINSTSVYSSGTGSTSTDSGNTWVNQTGDFYFNVYAKTATTTAFVAGLTGAANDKTSTDGASYTADTYRASGHMCLVGTRLVRSVRQQNASTPSGLIEWTEDGVNWNSDLIACGDPGTPITYLLQLADVLIVCKEDGVFAVDILATPIDVQQIYASNRVATNGLGAAVWRGAAYIPFNGRLMAVEGDFTSGFTMHESVGIESLQEWDWPWGAGRHVACAGTRYHLYSVVSTSGGYRLLKSANPLRKKADGVPDPEWHGSLATIGDGSQTVQFLAHFDPGGTASPQLFCSTTSNDIARIQLPRSFNPASDPNYPYDVSTTGDLYFPYANGNYPVHPKSWLTDSITFQRATPSDYAEMLYDDLNGEGWRRMPGGRLYDTGVLAYPRGLASQLLARRVRLVNTLATASPLLHAFGLAYAMRHVKGAAMREITFSVVAEDGTSAGDLGELRNTGADTQRMLLALAAGGGGGTRRMEDPYGRVYQRVQLLDATEVLRQTGRDGGGRTIIQVSAVAVG